MIETHGIEDASGRSDDEELVPRSVEEVIDHLSGARCGDIQLKGDFEPASTAEREE